VELIGISAKGGCAFGVEPFLVELRRIELPTYSLRTNRSPKLSYSPITINRLKNFSLYSDLFVANPPQADSPKLSYSPFYLCNIIILRSEFNIRTAVSHITVDIPLDGFFDSVLERCLCRPS
jgi:hypothetical protein